MNLCTARVAPEKAVFRPALPLHVQPEFTGEHAMTNFKEQYLHPAWQKKRLEALEAAGWKCTCCGAKEETLHVHHKQYIRGRKVWEYSLDELEVLCAGCHKSEHDLKDLMQRVLDDADIGGTSTVVALVAGYAAGMCAIDDQVARTAAEVDPETYDVGVIAAMAVGAEPAKLAAAAKVLTAGRGMSPMEQVAFERWGTALDERSGAELLFDILANARILGEMKEKQPVTKATGLLAGYYFAHFAGELPAELAAAAWRVAPASFAWGVAMAGMSGTVYCKDLARLIEEGHARTGQPMSDEVAKLVRAWSQVEATKHPADGEAKGG